MEITLDGKQKFETLGMATVVEPFVIAGKNVLSPTSKRLLRESLIFDTELNLEGVTALSFLDGETRSTMLSPYVSLF